MHVLWLIVKKPLTLPRQKSGQQNTEKFLFPNVKMFKKQTINKDLLESTGNPAQQSAITHMGTGSGEEWIYVYI